MTLLPRINYTMTLLPLASTTFNTAKTVSQVTKNALLIISLQIFQTWIILLHAYPPVVSTTTVLSFIKDSFVKKLWLQD